MTKQPYMKQVLCYGVVAELLMTGGQEESSKKPLSIEVPTHVVKPDSASLRHGTNRRSGYDKDLERQNNSS